MFRFVHGLEIAKSVDLSCFVRPFGFLSFPMPENNGQNFQYALIRIILIFATTKLVLLIQVPIKSDQTIYKIWLVKRFWIFITFFICSLIGAKVEF